MTDQRLLNPQCSNTTAADDTYKCMFVLFFFFTLFICFVENKFGISCESSAINITLLCIKSEHQICLRKLVVYIHV